jgi:hypothetical protein
MFTSIVVARTDYAGKRSNCGECKPQLVSLDWSLEVRAAHWLAASCLYCPYLLSFVFDNICIHEPSRGYSTPHAYYTITYLPLPFSWHGSAHCPTSPDFRPLAGLATALVKQEAQAEALQEDVGRLQTREKVLRAELDIALHQYVPRVHINAGQWYFGRDDG